MPPKKTDNKVQHLTPRDTEVIDTILQAFPPQSKPKIDWTAIAQKLGLKNEPTAKETFRVLCRKRNWFNAIDSQSEAGPKSSLNPQKDDATKDETHERASNIKKYNTRRRTKKEPQAELKPSTTKLTETAESQEETFSDDESDFGCA
ncbi:hypothetical protein F5Y00DRAFT_271007 [Daldinia vernicosa]|uniref:uncharacterized protein n=1 Tax=Daldinia vernicosa TaxID=114800 RepID=UPI00200862FF|nr:uncharacterized protein F5Y00DRAFT_271007 [Daldinia vernicosa]KAI0847666.1 hypothetical protein F5Y00DRAFT_271007 [Daldinia vernicosa]